jgi:hypothetical protein
MIWGALSSLDAFSSTRLLLTTALSWYQPALFAISGTDLYFGVSYVLSEERSLTARIGRASCDDG